VVVCHFIMRITLDAEVIRDLEELTGKKISRNGNEIIREVTEMVENSQKPDSPCWMESSCSDQDEDEGS